MPLPDCASPLLYSSSAPAFEVEDTRSPGATVAGPASGLDLSAALDKEVSTHLRNLGCSACLLIHHPLCAQLDEEALSDLSYAFMAIDLDHSGTLDASELLQVRRACTFPFPTPF